MATYFLCKLNKLNKQNSLHLYPRRSHMVLKVNIFAIEYNFQTSFAEDTTPISSNTKNSKSDTNAKTSWLFWGRFSGFTCCRKLLLSMIGLQNVSELRRHNASCHANVIYRVLDFIHQVYPFSRII